MITSLWKASSLYTLPLWQGQHRGHRIVVRPALIYLRLSATTYCYRQSEMLEWSAYLGLFLAAFGAATILPFQSEPVLVGLLLAGEFSPFRLILVASVGNVLGAAVNWGLGRYIERYRDKSWFPVKEAQLQRAEGWYRRFGRWSLLLSWMPLFGDALTVLSGVLREPFWSFLILVSIAKAGRYVVLAFATLGAQAILPF